MAARLGSARAGALVGIVMGSDSDWPVMADAAAALDEFEVPYAVHVLSAHRTPRDMLDWAEAAAAAGTSTTVAWLHSARTWS